MHIDSARGLAMLASGEAPDPYVEVMLLPENARNPSKRTTGKTKTCDPVFTENIIVRKLNFVYVFLSLAPLSHDTVRSIPK